VRDVAASPALQLDPAVIDEIADRLSHAVMARVVEVMRVEGLIPQARVARAWLDAQEVAQRLGVSRDWVYEHAEELGVSRIGTGPRPRLRFPPQILDRPGGKPVPPQTATRSQGKANGLIPIHGS
jgi:predicted DNA-binding transcriptional regulator AlpA